MLKLAVRFLEPGRGGMARSTALMAVIGIAAGVGGILITSAVSRGFHQALKEKLLLYTPHISIFRHDGKPIENGEEIRRQLAETGQTLSVNGSATLYTVIAGNNERAFASLTAVESGRSSGVSIGAELAKKIGIDAGEWADLMVFTDTTEPRLTRVLISEIVSTGVHDLDSTLINASTGEFAAISGSEVFRPTELRVGIKDVMSSEAVAERLKPLIGQEHHVLSWQEANKPVLSAIDLESKAAWFIFLLVGMIAAANITAAVSLLVTERRADIAVLRSCGIRTGQVMSIFLLQAIIVGMAGASLGILLAVVGCSIANNFWAIEVPGDIYLVNTFKLILSWTDVLIAALAALLLATAAGAYPALAATRIKPIEDLRRR